MKPDVSIIIRCYNEEAHIGRLLEGIAQQTVRNTQIVVVDSGSTDRTLEIVRAYRVEVVSIPPEEFSFGRSLNLGCRIASGDILVLASAHVYPVYRDWLEHLLAPFQDPAIALSYGKQRGAPTTKYSEHQVFAKWFPDRHVQTQSHPFCNNANAAVRRSVWELLPYDELLTGLEDLDWAKRAMRSGWRIAYVPEAEIIHVHDETYSRIHNRYKREAIALKQVYPEERFGLRDFARLLASNVMSDCIHAWRDGLLLREVGGIAAFRLMQFWGTYRGFAQRGPVTRDLKERFYYPNGWRRASNVAANAASARRVRYDAAARK